jgi:hypothetical protein
VPDPNRLLNMDDVAKRCNVRVGIVKRMHSSGDLPFRKVGRVLVVSAGELEDWIESKTIRRTAAILPHGEPLPLRFTLYRFYDASGVLLYVGITAMGVSRWAAHAKDKPWWTEVATVRVEHMDSLPELLAAELVAIRSEQPKYNVQGKPR